MRVRTGSALLTLAAGISLIGGCTGASAQRDEEPTTRTGQQSCFNRRQAQNFDVLDRSTLIVYAPTRNFAYLVQVSPPSTRLPYATAIAFDARTNQVCGRAGERLVVDGENMWRLAVLDVRRLPREELDRILENQRSGEPGEVLEPEEGAPAEIEPIETAPDG